MRKLLFLNSAQRFSDFALLLLRLFVGLFLIRTMWGYVTNANALRDHAAFLAKHDLPVPELCAAAIVYSTLLIGIAFVLGLLTRWAGIFCVVIYSVGIFLIDRHYGNTAMVISGFLIAVGFYLATHGAGRFSLDALLRANDLPRSNGGVRFKS
jgi:putative oxidoreductase